MLKPALQKDEALLRDIAESYNEGDDFGVWWLGQSGFLVKYQGHQLLFDPYLSDSLTKKYAETNKPHVRVSELVVDPAKMIGIEVVTSSHNHTDHLDADTLIPLELANPGMTLVLPEANIRFATERLKNQPPDMAGLDDGKNVQLGGFRVTGVAAAHNTIETDENGRCKFIGFIVDFGPWTIYHSGDTLWHPGLVETLIFHKPHLMLLPINGNKPERRVAGNLNPQEAAALAKAANARMVIPCHYDMFAFNTADSADFVSACDGLGQPQTVLIAQRHWRHRLRAFLANLQI
ncbi:MAG: MBL fold metallo-hydrolase [Verrucomicrobiales bacterium]